MYSASASLIKPFEITENYFIKNKFIKKINKSNTLFYGLSYKKNPTFYVKNINIWVVNVTYKKV